MIIRLSLREDGELDPMGAGKARQIAVKLTVEFVPEKCCEGRTAGNTDIESYAETWIDAG